jgi:hypothetical protein
MTNFKITLTFQFPAWDEVDGYDYFFSAKNKTDAIKKARRQAEHDGHAISGRGKYWFKAVETDEAPTDRSDRFWWES